MMAKCAVIVLNLGGIQTERQEDAARNLRLDPFDDRGHALADPDAAYTISARYVEDLADPAVEKQVLAATLAQFQRAIEQGLGGQNMTALVDALPVRSARSP